MSEPALTAEQDLRYAVERAQSEGVLSAFVPVPKLAALLSQKEAAEERAGRAERALREVEWRGEREHGNFKPCCPECGGHRPFHRSGCDLDAALAPDASPEPACKECRDTGYALAPGGYAHGDAPDSPCPACAVASPAAEADPYEGSAREAADIEAFDRLGRHDGPAAEAETPCPECFGKGLENQDAGPGILLGPLGELPCRACRGTGKQAAGGPGVTGEAP